MLRTTSPAVLISLFALSLMAESAAYARELRRLPPDHVARTRRECVLKFVDPAPEKNELYQVSPGGITTQALKIASCAGVLRVPRDAVGYTDSARPRGSRDLNFYCYPIRFDAEIKRCIDSLPEHEVPDSSRAPTRAPSSLPITK